VKLGHFPFGRGFCTLMSIYIKRATKKKKEQGALQLVQLGYKPFLTYEDFHLLVKPIIHYKRVAHAYTRGFHSKTINVEIG
jgi:hypothetical protein